MSKKVLVRKRIRAIALWQKNVPKEEIIQELGVSRVVINKWIRLYKKEGLKGLTTVKVSSAALKSYLSQLQVRVLLEWLTHGATDHGFPDDKWTPSRVSILIKKKFGVKYKPTSINRLLERFGTRVKTQRDHDELNKLLSVVKRSNPELWNYQSRYWTAPIVSDLSEILFGYRYSTQQIYKYFSAHKWSFHKNRRPRKAVK